MKLTAHALLTWLQDEWGLTEVEGHTLLFSSGLLDSLAMVDLMGFIEAQGAPKVRWHEVTLDNLDSVDRILAYVSRRRGGG